MNDADRSSEPTPLPGWSAPVVRVSRRNLWILGIAGTSLLIAGVWLVVAMLPRFLGHNPNGTADGTTSTPSTDARKIRATLLYVSADGAALVPVSREVLYGATPTEQARHILEEEVLAPPNGLRSAIPAGTTVRAVFLTREGQAYVDLGGPIVTGHSGGSLDEALAVYAIVNTVALNLPTITAVQILVDGKQVDSLAGHLDLRSPLSKSLDWIRKGP